MTWAFPGSSEMLSPGEPVAISGPIHCVSISVNGSDCDSLSWICPLELKLRRSDLTSITTDNLDECDGQWRRMGLSEKVEIF